MSVAKGWLVRITTAATLAWALGFLMPAVATGQEEIYVVDKNTSSVNVYSVAASGNAAPLRSISGPATRLMSPVDIAVDEPHGELFVVKRASINNMYK